MPVMVFHTVPDVFKSPGRVAYGIFNGLTGAAAGFNGRCLAVMSKNPILSHRAEQNRLSRNPYVYD